jgi:hypothetical protein
MDGENREEPTDPTELQKSRPAWQEFSRNMYGTALAQLEEHLKRMKTEGVGDCWLLSILAGFEVKDPELVAGLNPQQREEICTSRRKDIVSWAADWKRNGGFRFLCDQLGITISGDDEAAKKKASQEVQERLKPWREAFHYGYNQTEMHAITGWFLERNMLQIDRDAQQCTGHKESALNATHRPAL